jgi:hypothetical protein
LSDDIFREIDEDLRRDRVENLWRRHGRLVIGAAVLLVVGTGGFQVWRHSQQSTAEAAGLAYFKAVQLAEQDPAAAAASFEGIGAGKAAGYAVLARIQAAVIKLKNGGDKPGGMAGLRAVAADSGVDQPYRDLALLLSAEYAIDDEPAASIIERLKPLTAESNPWRFSARELTALAEIKGGDKAAGIKTYQQLADDLDAPAGLRARATAIVEALGQQG